MSHRRQVMGKTGLDYADQRWHGAGTGRFLTADPYQASGGPGEPGSWNRYGYVRGDPASRLDPDGLADIEVTVWAFANWGCATPWMKYVNPACRPSESGEAKDILGGGGGGVEQRGGGVGVVQQGSFGWGPSS